MKPAETFGERRFEHDESEEASRPAAGYRLILWDCLWVNKIQWSEDVNIQLAPITGKGVRAPVYLSIFPFSIVLSTLVFVRFALRRVVIISYNLLHTNVSSWVWFPCLRFSSWEVSQL